MRSSMYDRNSADKYGRRSSERRSPERRTPKRRSPEIRSPERRSPDRRSPDINQRRDDRFQRPESEQKSYDYGRRSSTESFQTVKIKRSDLEEIRRKYDLRFKDRNQNTMSEDNRMDSSTRQSDSRDNFYKYSSNMRNSSGQSRATRSSSADKARVNTQSSHRKPRKKAEWRVRNHFFLSD